LSIKSDDKGSSDNEDWSNDVFHYMNNLHYENSFYLFNILFCSIVIIFHNITFFYSKMHNMYVTILFKASIAFTFSTLCCFWTSVQTDNILHAWFKQY